MAFVITEFAYLFWFLAIWTRSYYKKRMCILKKHDGVMSVFGNAKCVSKYGFFIFKLLFDLDFQYSKLLKTIISVCCIVK